jgi:hypothetical protein
MPLPSSAARVSPRLLKRRDQLPLGDMLQRLAVLDPDALQAIRMIARDALRAAHKRHQRYLPHDSLNKLCLILAVSALSLACQQTPPSIQLSPAAPTVQVPTRLTLTAQTGIGSTAKQTIVTAKLLDQDGRGIASVPVTFSSSKGRIDPSTVTTTMNGDARTTLTSGTVTTVAVSGAGLQASLDVAVDAPLSVSLNVPRLEKRIPATFSASVTGDPDPPLRYRWDFGDGQTATTETASIGHTYADDGRVTIALTVTDAIERSGSYYACAAKFFAERANLGENTHVVCLMNDGRIIGIDVKKIRKLWQRGGRARIPKWERLPPYYEIDGPIKGSDDMPPGSGLI